MSNPTGFELIEIACPTISEVIDEVNQLSGEIVWMIKNKTNVQAVVKIRKHYTDV